MPKDTEELIDPPPVVRLGRVDSPRGVRRAVTRVVDAVLAGNLSPKVGNTAIYGLQTIMRVIESELLESRLSRLEEHAGLDKRPSARLPRMVGHA